MLALSIMGGKIRKSDQDNKTWFLCYLINGCGQFLMILLVSTRGIDSNSTASYFHVDFWSVADDVVLKFDPFAVSELAMLEAVDSADCCVVCC